MIVADIGGRAGTATNDLNNLRTTEGKEIFEAFQIDPYPHLLEEKEALPLNRFIKADANDMPEVPTDTFHMVISFNALTYTDLAQSLPEIKRILRPGGIALLDIEHWSHEKKVEGVKKSGLADEVKMIIRGVEPIPYLNIKEKLADLNPTEQMLAKMGGTCFILE